MYGFFVGVLAKSIFYKEDTGGIVFTVALGMTGSFLSGFILSLFNIPTSTSLSLYGLIPATIGALVVMGTYSYFSK